MAKLGIIIDELSYKYSRRSKDAWYFYQLEHESHANSEHPISKLRQKRVAPKFEDLEWDDKIRVCVGLDPRCENLLKVEGWDFAHCGPKPIVKETYNFKYIKRDYAEVLSFNSGQFEFPNPLTMEFRGIGELYNMVMLKLMFIFLFLLILCVYQGLKIAALYASQWSKVKTILREEGRLADFCELWSCAYHDYEKERHLSEITPRPEHKSLQIENYWWTVMAWASETGKPSGISSVSTKIVNYYIKIDIFFSSTSFWVYYSKLEFVWTFLPCIVLFFISLPSFTLALALDEAHKPATWTKVLGSQWFWVYESSNHETEIVLYSNIVYGQDLTDNALRAIEADCVVTLVNNKFNRVLVTSADVIHCWAVPNLGIKIDACPGRINTVSVMPTKCGVYYGQCSEICGVNHGFMPIVVEVVV